METSTVKIDSGKEFDVYSVDISNDGRLFILLSDNRDLREIMIDFDSFSKIEYFNAIKKEKRTFKGYKEILSVSRIMGDVVQIVLNK